MIFRAAARNHGHSEDMTILKNIRPYQPGDPMKRINWRHLAGSGRMEVNVYEAIMPGAFVLDLWSFRETVVRTGSQGEEYEEPVLLERCMEELAAVDYQIRQVEFRSGPRRQ